jgi:hypothetical protein
VARRRRPGGGRSANASHIRARRERQAGEGRRGPLIIKANYCTRDGDAPKRAKATIRYIQHRRDREDERVTRDLFGFGGTLDKQTAYQMIDAAPEQRRYYYRMIISPDPRREDSYRDLDLQSLTIETMLKLEERLGHPIQFIAAIHDDHSPHRHVHTLVIHNGRRLTREDFAMLRNYGKQRALTKRRFLDRQRRLELMRERSRSYRPPFADGGTTGNFHPAGSQKTPQSHAHGYYARRDHTRGRFSHPPVTLCSYTCPVCGRYQALPYSRTGYRCLVDGVYLRREKEKGYARIQGKSFGMERELTL